MKSLIHKYITSWTIPMYKRLVPKVKRLYDKYIDWKYGISNSTYLSPNTEEYYIRNRQLKEHVRKKRKYNHDVFRVTGIGTGECKIELNNVKKIDYKEDDQQNNKGEI